MPIRSFFRMSGMIESSQGLRDAPLSGTELPFYEVGSFQEWMLPANTPSDLQEHVGLGLAVIDGYLEEDSQWVVIQRDVPAAEPVPVEEIFPPEVLSACLKDADPRVRENFFHLLAEVIRPYSRLAADDLAGIGRY